MRRHSLVTAIAVGLLANPFDCSLFSVKASAEPRPSQVWSPQTSTAALALKNDAKQLSTLALAGNDRFLVAGSTDRLLVWDTEEWRRADDIVTGYQVWSITGIPNTHSVVVAGVDGYLEIIDIKHRKRQFRLTGHTGSVFRVACSQDGTTIASGDDQGNVKLWNARDRQQIHDFSVDNKGNSICALNFTPDGTNLGTCTQGEVLALWNIASRKVTLRLAHQGVNCRSVAFSPDGTRFATRRRGEPPAAESIIMYESSTGRELFRRQVGFADPLWQIKQDHLYVVDGPRVSQWNSADGSGELSARLTDGWIQNAVVTADGQVMITLDGRSKVLVHRLQPKGWFATHTTPELPAEASMNGRYYDLLRVYPAPDVARIRGRLCEVGWRPAYDDVHSEDYVEGFHVYLQPNWYVFACSRIGLHHPPKQLPEPATFRSTMMRIWVAMPQAGVCRQAVEASATHLPEKSKFIKHAFFHWRHSLQPPEGDAKKKNSWRCGIMEVRFDPTLTTERLLEELQSLNFGLADAIVLGEADARAAIPAEEFGP